MGRRAEAAEMDRVIGTVEILINAGQRGVMLKMDPKDIVAALDCRVASIAR